MTTAFVLIWIFSSNFDIESYSGSARFENLKACEVAREEIRSSRTRRYDLLKCFAVRID